jgi:hypothetical protein
MTKRVNFPETNPGLKGINSIAHPEYLDNEILWEKWRLTYGGGTPFINRYLKKFSSREDNVDFNSRKDLTYVPAHAKQAVDEIKYALIQRNSDVIRIGGPATWQKAIQGQIGGVDLLDSTMNGYISKEIVTELLVKGKVGVYVDMPELDGYTLADKGDKHPYLHMYWAEDIRSWVYENRTKKFTQLLLRDWDHFVDPVSGLPMNWAERYRYFYINPADGFVYVTYFDQVGKPLTADGQISDAPNPIRLDITEIPFVVGELDHSLMVDICDYQIAMLNMASADVDFCVKANYPFYIEMRDSRVQSDHLRTTDNSAPNGVTSDAQGVVQAAQAEQVKATTSTTPTVRTGVSYGRRYGFGLEPPAFIHPSSEPLKASMEKQAQMKAEIRELVHLSVSRLDPAKASAESKMQDEGALENGLSVIGQELEKMERQIVRYWGIYEGETDTKVTISYPSNYSLVTDDDRRKAAKDLAEQLPVVPSKTYQKEIAKEIAHKLLAHKIPTKVLDQIKREIDAAQAMTTDSKTIVQDLENGLVSLETASELRGYGKGEAEKAKKDHAERLARIAESQAANSPANNPASRGISDASGNPAKDASAEKAASRDTTVDEKPTDKTRGEGQ